MTSALVGLIVFGVVGLLLLGVFIWLSRDERQTHARVRALASESNASSPSFSPVSNPVPELPLPGQADGGASWSSLLEEPGQPNKQRKASRDSKTTLPARSEQENAREDPHYAKGFLQLGKLLVSNNEKKRAQAQLRLVRAGFYSARALPLFLGVRFAMMFVAGVSVLLPGLLGLLSLYQTLGGIALGVGGASILSGLYLDMRTRSRQRALRRALPDFLDMVVLCVEGGMALPSAVRRVTMELRSVHPLLGEEMSIAQREMMLGMTLGEATQKLGMRTDVEEIRNLASMLVQNDRFGAGVGKALRIHADTLREQREEYAEELAQKAAVKILFPTLLCIFPAIFIVILGPAALQIMKVFSSMK